MWLKIDEKGARKMQVNMDISNKGYSNIQSANVMKREQGQSKFSEEVKEYQNQKQGEAQQSDLQKAQLDEKSIIKAIEKANKKISDKSKEFEFSVHEQTKQIMVKVIDSQTHKVIKEFPPEKILDMVAKMCEEAGIFVDEKR